ncbi:MAG: DUF134 domain-containing protein [Candidatus Helarchaeales archaeon]
MQRGRRGGRGHGRRFGPKCGRGRPIIPRNVQKPLFTHFIPVVPPELADKANPTPMYLFEDEFEAIRQVDLLNMTQDEAGQAMNISRGTVWRLVQSGRRKLIQTIVEGRQLYIVPR